jgi:hypothetical protein
MEGVGSASLLTRVYMAKEDAWAKTYNSGYSLVVTHLTTNPPVRCLNRAERTGSLVFNVLWSYVKEVAKYVVHIVGPISLAMWPNVELPQAAMRLHSMVTNICLRSH